MHKINLRTSSYLIKCAYIQKKNQELEELLRPVYGFQPQAEVIVADTEALPTQPRPQQPSVNTNVFGFKLGKYVISLVFLLLLFFLLH